MKYIKVLSIVCLSLLINDSYALRHKHNTGNKPTAQQLNTIQPNANDNNINNMQINTQLNNSFRGINNINSIQNNNLQHNNSNHQHNNIKLKNVKKIFRNDIQNKKINSLVDSYFKNCDENDRQNIQDCLETYKQCNKYNIKILNDILDLGLKLEEENNKEFMNTDSKNAIDFMLELNDKYIQFIKNKNSELCELQKISSIIDLGNEKTEIINIEKDKTSKGIAKINKKLNVLQNYYELIKQCCTETQFISNGKVDTLLEILDSLNEHNPKQENFLNKHDPKQEDEKQEDEKQEDEKEE